MKRLLLSSFIALNSLMALAQSKISEGTITYTVEWTLPPQAPPQMASMMPKELTVYFKGDSSATLAESSMSTSKTIMDSKTEYVRLLLDIPMMNKKYSVLFTPDDMEQMKERWPEFTLTPSADTKTVAGYKAKKYTVKDGKSGQTFDAWITKDVDIVPNSLTQFFDKSYGVPLEFHTFQNGMGIQATVKAIKTDTVPTGTFSGSKDYEEITFDQLRGMMSGGH